MLEGRAEASVFRREKEGGKTNCIYVIPRDIHCWNPVFTSLKYKYKYDTKSQQGEQRPNLCVYGLSFNCDYRFLSESGKYFRQACLEHDGE